MNEPTIYYRQIPVTTPPEKEGEYDTNTGKGIYNKEYNEWYSERCVLYYFLPIPSEELALSNPTEYRRGFDEGEQGQMERQQQIAILFAEWCEWDHEGYGFLGSRKWQKEGNQKYFTTSELYNSNEFKEYLKEKGL
jgi:hypothetical protein